MNGAPKLGGFCICIIGLTPGGQLIGWTPGGQLIGPNWLGLRFDGTEPEGSATADVNDGGSAGTDCF